MVRSSSSARKPKVKKRKNPVVADETETTTGSEVIKDKNKKRNGTSDTAVSAPCPNKKKKPTAAESNSNENEDTYVAGALSALFGKNVDAKVDEAPREFETSIKPKVETPDGKKETREGKTKKIATKNVKEAEHKDREQQRENRKKGKEGMTAQDKERTVFVGNMPLSLTPKDVKRIFSEFGEVDSVRMRGIMPTKETVSKRVAHLTGKFHEKQNSVNFYVKFKEPEEVQKALTYNGTELEGHKIRVDGVTGRRDYDSKATIFVGNLPFDATEDALSSFFESEVGPVVFSRCVRDKSSGMGKGYGFVIFKSSTSVDLALGMNDLKFADRDIRITKVLKKNKLKLLKTGQKGQNKQKAAKLDKKMENKLENFKFSTKKARSDDQNTRRMLKKSAKKAIAKKKQGNRKSIMS